MKSLIFLIMVIKTIVSLSVVTRDNPVVSTPKGQIRGLPAKDGDYNVFLGIPYAVVDESKPFEPSTPHPGFKGIFDATKGGVECIQAMSSPVTGVIQCLQLNVHVPKTASPSNTLPVMIFIHGGGFIVGSKEENPRFLVKHDVIVVTLNYRLGLYGFLCSSEQGLKNVGLKDQALAIKWVKENIASFGGNVDLITIFGQSGGAMSLDLHLLATENLAKRVILMSGTALTTWVLPGEENDDRPINLARELGFNGTDIKGAIQFLSSVDPNLAVATADRLQYAATAEGLLTVPCIEPASDNAILADYPVNLQPKVKGMDIMIGYVDKEMMFMYPNADNLQFYRNYSFERELLFEFDEAYDVDEIRQLYIGDEQPNENLQDAILDYASDFAFVHPVERTVNKFLDAGANKVYKYLFSYEGARNFFKMVNNLTAPGACHVDDLGYLFDIAMFEGVPISEADQRIVDALAKLWTDFAKYGNPTPEPTDLIPEWKPVDKEQRPYLNIDNPITSENLVFKERMAFWDRYYQKYGHKVIGYKARKGNLRV